MESFSLATRKACGDAKEAHTAKNNNDSNKDGDNNDTNKIAAIASQSITTITNHPQTIFTTNKDLESRTWR